MEILPPSTHNREVSPELDAVVMKAVAKKPEERFATASDMAIALEHAVRPASTREVSAWMEEHLGESLNRRRRVVAEIESSTSAPGRGELLKMIDASGDPLSGPLPPSAPSLPRAPLPDASGSGPNLQPSTASLTLSRHPPPPGSRAWLVVMGLLLLPVLGGGVALGIALSRPVTPPTVHAASTEAQTASVVVPPPASATPIASASAPPSASASSKPAVRKPITASPSTKPTTARPPDDLDKLIQTGH